MGDEIDAVRWSALASKFGALDAPVSRATEVARGVHITAYISRTVILLPAVFLYGLAVFELWQVLHNPLAWQNGAWQWFWIAAIGGFIISLSMSSVGKRNDTEARQVLQILKGAYALRQVAISGDNRLAPMLEAPSSTDSDEQRSSKQVFSVVSDEQGVKWQLPTVLFGRHSVEAPWRNVQALVTFKATQDSKSGETSEVFLLDTTTEALTWRITPKTPASVREAHERFVRMANEHVQLRDITASLKNLLESPETRSYEYAVIALSGPAPVPPAVRTVLTTPVRESHFLRGYLIIAMILLALLVAAGLLLQFGVIPAGSF